MLFRSTYCRTRTYINRLLDGRRWSCHEHSQLWNVPRWNPVSQNNPITECIRKYLTAIVVLWESPLILFYYHPLTGVVLTLGISNHVKRIKRSYRVWRIKCVNCGKKNYRRQESDVSYIYWNFISRNFNLCNIVHKVTSTRIKWLMIKYSIKKSNF